VFTTVAVDFLPPEKKSRWHMIRCEFRPPQGASRPVFLTAPYPPGDGIGLDSTEQAQIVAAMGRQAMVELTFTVNEYGIPGNFQVEQASTETWGNEAIAIVHEWRFKAGEKDGVPVPVPCTVDLVWGQKQLTARGISRLASALHTPPDGGAGPRIMVEKSEACCTPQALDARVEGVVVLSMLLGADGIRGSYRAALRPNPAERPNDLLSG